MSTDPEVQRVQSAAVVPGAAGFSQLDGLLHDEHVELNIGLRGGTIRKTCRRENWHPAQGVMSVMTLEQCRLEKGPQV